MAVGSTPETRESVRRESTFREHFRPAPSLRPKDAAALLGAAWSNVTGQVADKRTTQILTAHWAVETDGGRCMPGHNFAGIKATPGAPGALLHTVEGYGKERREVSARFRTYANDEAGAHDYVRLLARRYPAALEAARAGDSQEFSRALARGGYFTANPDAYAHALEVRLSALERGSEAGVRMSPGSATSAPALQEAALGGLLRALRPSRDEA